MKKKQHRTSRFLKRKSQSQPEHPGRITNETVAKHREQILAGGRKFKYPYQYARHKLVINTVAIGVVVVLILVVFGWWQLYRVQNTGEFMYRVTSVVPVSVGSVDGEQIRYSDYLMRYRSQQYGLKSQNQLGLSSKDSTRQLDYVKRQVFEGLVADMYAQKIAPKYNVTVSDQDVQKVIDSKRVTANGTVSQEVFYNNSIKNILNLDPDEYRHMVRQSLVQQKVGYAVDSVAQKTRDEVTAALFASKKRITFSDVIKKFGAKNPNIEFGASGMVPKENKDGGLTQQVLQMKDGEVSHAIESTTGDGYYFVQRLQANDKQVSYQFIRIRLTAFDGMLQNLKKQDKVHEYIDLPKVDVKGIK